MKAAVLSLFAASVAGESPITKVISTLKKMKDNLEDNKENDGAQFKKMECWCKKMEEQKTKEIAQAEANIQELTQKISDAKALHTTEVTKSKQLKDDIATQTESLEKAKSISAKALQNFNDDEKATMQAIKQLTSAITVLKGQGLVQVAVDALKKVDLRRHSSPEDFAMLDEFIQGGKDFFGAKPIGANSYNRRSDSIVGILEQMHRDMQDDLGAARQAELKRGKEAAAMIQELKTSIAADKESLSASKTVAAEALADERQATVDLKDTKDALSDEQKNLMDGKMMCQNLEQEWELRQKENAKELEAVNAALGVLDTDENFDLFSRSQKTVGKQPEEFLQVESRAQAASVLIQAAHGNPKMMLLANKVKLDALTKVHAAIDKQVAVLKENMKNHRTKHDWCVDTKNSNDLKKDQLDHEKENLDSKKDELENVISGLEAKMEQLQENIKTNTEELQDASEKRAEANKEFVAKHSDAVATVQILKKAEAKLALVYGSKASLLQKSKQTPAPQFQTYKKQSGGVLGLIAKIVSEYQVSISEFETQEAADQKNYDEYTAQTKATLKDLGNQFATSEAEKGEAQASLSDTEQSLANKKEEIFDLDTAAQTLAQECDHLTTNFEAKMEGHETEIKALLKAQQILRGSSGFLQA